VLKAQFWRAERVALASLTGSSSVSSAHVMVTSASATPRRYLAEMCGHFMSAYWQAKAYQDVGGASSRTREIGRPVATSKASPRRIAASS
jgi:hypothetical protein